MALVPIDKTTIYRALEFTFVWLLGPRIREGGRFVLVGGEAHAQPKLLNFITNRLCNVNPELHGLGIMLQEIRVAALLLNQSLPGSAIVAKETFRIGWFSNHYPYPLANARQETRKPSLLGHDVLCAVNEHGDELGGRLAFENQAGYAPFEIAQGAFGVLVAAGFGEDVDPGVAVGGIDRGGDEGV